MELALLITVAIVLAIVNLANIFLTLIGLPGIWIMLALAIAAQFLPVERSEMFNWWTIFACVVLGLLGELVEFLGSAVTSTSAGGTRRASLFAIVGGIVGAILGSATPPIIGALIWGVVGAGIGGLIGEVTGGAETRHAISIGRAAARGKFIGAVAKTGLALVIYLILTIASFVP